MNRPINPDKWHRWTAFLPSPVVNGFATIGPVGYWGKAPGTNGSIVGVLLFTLVFFALPPFIYLLMLAVWIYLAIAFCGEAEKRLHKRDPGEVILDEVVAMPVCFLGLSGAIYQYGPWAWTILLAGFGLFRFFDILKPLGIKQLQSLPGGLGVVVDDLVAGLATCVCLHVLVGLTSPYVVS